MTNASMVFPGRGEADVVPVPGGVELTLGHLGEWLSVELTPAEAQGLAQRLLKEAAEVQFAASLNTAADGGES